LGYPRQNWFVGFKRLKGILIVSERRRTIAINFNVASEKIVLSSSINDSWVEFKIIFIPHHNPSKGEQREETHFGGTFITTSNYENGYLVWVPSHWEERSGPEGGVEKVWVPGYRRYGP
jgi:hypothetical protein